MKSNLKSDTLLHLLDQVDGLTDDQLSELERMVDSDLTPADARQVKLRIGIVRNRRTKGSN